MTPHYREMDRRTFLTALALAGAPLSLPAPASEGDLQVLKQDDTERLRLDFNANRSKVRVVPVLSPT